MTASFARWAVLVADREGDIEREVAAMKRRGLLSDETAILWESSFEEVHFTDEELIHMARELAAQRGIELNLSSSDFRASYDDHRERAGKDARGAASFLLGMAANPAHGGVRISKPDLADLMADQLLNELETRGDEAVEQRPILGVIAAILRVA